jgi:UDP-N-acetylmuramate dehydrogenase
MLFTKKDVILPSKFQANVSLKKFTTFKIGGKAKYLICIKSFQDALSALRFANNHQLPFTVIGKGSNILLDSKGYNGLIILNRIDHLMIDKSKITVGAGYRYPHLACKTLQKNLSGLEFAINIPATVGGAIFMNAGANGYETCTYLDEVTFLSNDLKLLTLKKDQLNFAYRKSPFQSMQGIILEAKFSLKALENSKRIQKELVNYRLQTQPTKSFSIGCVFQNPSKEVSAGYLIEKCNLKKIRIGEAYVSEKHANFIINENNASSDDVINLINFIRKVVKEKTGQTLKSEIRYIPYG